MSITDTAATGHPFATQTHGYTYDDSDRLLTGNQTAPGNYTYGYDTLDNATTVTVPGVGTTNPTYNVNNQLATWGANTYSYDANGNTLSGDGARTYKWDAENRLIEIDYVGTSNKTVFTYNGIGQRRAGAETIGGTTTTTRYLWCGSRICQSRDGSDNVLKRFLDEGEYALASGLKLVYMPDQLGSVRDVIDAATGSRVASFDYAPYGAITQSNVTNSVEYQFASLFNHPTSGLLISPSRAYDNVSGRWLSRDAISEPGGINLYVYGSANPIYLIDPSGYAPDACTGNPPTVFYHGTDPKSAFGLIVAAPLSVVVARELSRGGTLGFYLATSIADAEHFALLGRPEGAVVQFTFFGQALTELLSKGAFIQSIAPGKNYRPEGQELFIPPFLFGLFDRLRYTGEIVATPAKIN
jgi:RHS repeat-associated protein